MFLGKSYLSWWSVSDFNLSRHRAEIQTTLGPAKDLYDLLIGPIATDLKTQNVQTIVFVPDGALSLIPLAALHDGREFVVDHYAVVTLPGLTLLDPESFRRADRELKPVDAHSSSSWRVDR